MQKYMEYAVVWLLGAFGYTLLEVFWRGYTHWTMAIVGGIGLLVLYRLTSRMQGSPLLSQAVAGALLLTGVELVAGFIVNRVLLLNVWDYSTQRGNFLGQICPLYSLYWFFLCMAILPLIGLARRRIFSGRPRTVD